MAVHINTVKPANLELTAKLTLIQFVIGPHITIVRRVVACCVIPARVNPQYSFACKHKE